MRRCSDIYFLINCCLLTSGIFKSLKSSIFKNIPRNYSLSYLHNISRNYSYMKSKHINLFIKQIMFSTAENLDLYFLDPFRPSGYTCTHYKITEKCRLLPFSTKIWYFFYLYVLICIWYISCQTSPSVDAVIELILVCTIAYLLFRKYTLCVSCCV